MLAVVVIVELSLIHIYFKTSVGTDRIEWQRFLVLCREYHIDLDKPLKDFSKKELDIILYGSDKPITYTLQSSSGNVSKTTKPIAVSYTHLDVYKRQLILKEHLLQDIVLIKSKK